MKFRISKKLSVALLVIIPWALQSLGIDLQTLVDLLNSQQVMDAANQAGERIEAARQLVRGVKEATASDLPALVGVVYVIIQGWLDGKSKHDSQA